MQSKIDIMLSCNNSAEIFKIPILPEELPATEVEYNNVEFGTIDDTLILLSKKATRQDIELNFLIPEFPRKYQFAREWNYNSPEDYSDWLKSVAERKIPMRIVIYNGMDILLNKAVAVKKVSTYRNSQLDMVLTVTLQEYVFVKVV